MVDSSPITDAAGVLRRAEKVPVFTGAGVSAESGIPTFRDADGLWQEFPPQQYGHWAGILSAALWQPRKLAKFVHAVLEPIAEAKPNAAHRAIAEMEENVDVSVVTQNIDSLHQEAGSTTVWEVHGTMFQTCTLRGRFVNLIDRGQMRQAVAGLRKTQNSWFAHPRLAMNVRPLLGVGWRGVYRPAVVLFGEGLSEPAWTRAQQAAEECDLVISIGTSAAVFPAALLPSMAQDNGATVITIDPAGGEGDIVLRGPAGELVPELVRQAFGEN